MLPEKHFQSKAPWLMDRLIKDFELTTDDAAAIAGNAGHESLGFTKLQEMKPTVKGSRGGYGWFQWTGPRRKQYEAFCKAKELDPASDEANYQFLKLELATSEKRAIPAVKAAKGLRNKVIAFELAYERAGVKHYDKRTYWANLAAAAYAEMLAQAKPVEPVAPPPAPEPAPAPAPEASPEPEKRDPGTSVAAVILGALGALIAAMAAWIIGGGN